jgi:hypothetical protein
MLAALYAVRPKGHLPDSAPHPVCLPAHDVAEMRQAIRGHAEAVGSSDPADTRSVLTAAWYALCVAACLARFAAIRDHGAAACFVSSAEGPIADVMHALESAPSLPADIHGVGLDTDEPTETAPGLVTVAIDGVRILASMSAVVLERTAALARDPKDRAAAASARQATLRLAKFTAAGDAGSPRHSG